MPTSYSDRLRVALQATGDNPSTWGAIANQAVFELLDDAIAGVESITVGASNITLSTANGSEDQARKAVLKLSGVISADINLVVPNEEKVYFIDAGFTGTNTLTVKPTSGSGIGFTTGQKGVVYCDGVNVILITRNFDPVTLGLGNLAYLNTITSTGLLANGIVTTSVLAPGAITTSVLPSTLLNDILPVQTSSSGKSLVTDGLNVSWQNVTQTCLNVVHYYASGAVTPALGTNWATYPMTNLLFNNIPGASYSSNQVTLPAGTYKAEIFGTNYGAGGVQARLRNVTDGISSVLGCVGFGLNVGTGSYLAAIHQQSFGSGIFTITAPKVFELQWVGGGATYGVSTGENQVAASMLFTKIA